MNKKVKARWIKALTSGKYKQTRGTLHDSKGFCCLGVLCDVYSRSKDGKAEGAAWVTFDKIDGDTVVEYSMLGSTCVMPSAVREWAGLSDNDPTILDTKGANQSAAECNDGYNVNADASIVKPMSFKKIAKLIEKNL